MLPSQNARPSASRAHMYRRGKGKPWIMIAGGAAIVIVGILLVKWLIGGGEPASAEAQTPALQANAGESASTPSTTALPPAKSPPAASPAPPRGNTPKANPPAARIAAGEPVKIAMGGDLPGAKPNATDKPVSPENPIVPAKVATPPAADSPADSPAKSTTASQPQQPSGAPARMPAANPPPTSNGPISQRVQLGLDLIKQNKPVEARRTLSDALLASGVSGAEAERIRAELTNLNSRLVFGPDIIPGDPYVIAHQIASGETLAKIAKKLDLAVDWRFLQRINQIADPAKIRVGQRIKVVKGPFHTIIDKRTFRADLYMGDGSDRVYVRSLPVGLGEFGATPEGAFVVKPDSKLVDPAWTNPRTGEYFQSKDPKNPLGHYWIGLVGASDNIRGLESYGIHGTIEPDSIGKEQSMGCVRLGDEDIKLLYEVLTEHGSRIEIHGNDWP